MEIESPWIKEPIALFAYDFPHRKTNEFLKQLKYMGIENVLVFAAPKVKLGFKNQYEFFETMEFRDSLEDTKSICARLNYKYISIPHDSYDEIKNHAEQLKIRFAIISGARILKKQVIEIFLGGVLNFHPGKIPETSGLDSLYYTFKKGIEAGVTVHIIDEKVDAGKEWCFESIKLQSFDNLSTVSEKIFRLQVTLLGRFLRETSPRKLLVKPINREFKNSPMNLEEKVTNFLKFDDWLVSQITKQKSNEIYNACVTDDLEILKKYISISEINSPIAFSWSPLIVSAFHHSKNCLMWLIANGADVNQPNGKGTTPLMYAKTKYLKEDADNFELLDILIENGAEVDHKDIYGKSVIDYCQEAGSGSLVSYFMRHIKK